MGDYVHRITTAVFVTISILLGLLYLYMLALCAMQYSTFGKVWSEVGLRSLEVSHIQAGTEEVIRGEVVIKVIFR